METIPSLNLQEEDDLLDIVEDVERVFRIQFSDAEVGTLQTAGDFHDLVSQHLKEAGHPSAYYGAHVLNLFRKAIGGKDGQRLIPRQHLGELTAPGDARLLWRQLESETGLTLKPLSYPKQIWVFLFSVPAFLIFAAFNFASQPTSASMFIFFALCNLGIYLFMRQRGVKALPYIADTTIRTFVEDTVALNEDFLKEQVGDTPEAVVWPILRDIISGSADLEPDAIGQDTALMAENTA